MADAKIQIKIGVIEFSGEGQEEWVAAQLATVLSKAPELLKLAAATPVGSGSGGTHPPMGADLDIAKKPLATFLQQKSATTDQTKKFLATAVWLESKGATRNKTGDVTKALADNNQKRLGNASQCLAANISKGYCEKDGQSFYVTEEGKKSL